MCSVLTTLVGVSNPTLKHLTFFSQNTSVTHLPIIELFGVVGSWDIFFFINEYSDYSYLTPNFLFQPRQLSMLWLMLFTMIF
jgi:hypothetical protein